MRCTESGRELLRLRPRITVSRPGPGHQCTGNTAACECRMLEPPWNYICCSVEYPHVAIAARLLLSLQDEATAHLQDLPSNTFGGAYATFMDRRHFHADDRWQAVGGRGDTPWIAMWIDCLGRRSRCSIVSDDQLNCGNEARFFNVQATSTVHSRRGGGICSAAVAGGARYVACAIRVPHQRLWRAGAKSCGVCTGM